jgi:hypothetical protein
MNAGQPQNTLSIAMSEINASIFEIGESIPEGVYLDMMNNSKKLFDEVKILEDKNKIMEEKIKDRGVMSIAEKVEYTQFYEENICKLDTVNIGCDGEELYADFYEKDGSEIFTRREGDYIRIYGGAGNYKIMVIDKINKNSIIYRVYKKEVYGTFSVNSKVRLTVQHGENRISLGGKNILIYHSSEDFVEALYEKVMVAEEGYEMVYNELLKIDME